MKTATAFHGPRQRGAALAISLILLVIVTLLSVTAMRSATLDSRIAVNHQHKQLAFQAAENAFSKLSTLPPAQMRSLEVPGVVGAANATTMTDFVPTDSDTGSSADLRMELIEISPPGKYKFSGYGLNIVTIIYQADAFGEVDGTDTRTHHRMGMALIRD